MFLWLAAIEKGYAAPIWMTFKQALELKAHVRKGEQGSLSLCLSEIKFAHTDDEVRQEMA